MHDTNKAKATIYENFGKLGLLDLCLVQSQLSEHIHRVVQHALVQAEIQKQNGPGKEVEPSKDADRKPHRPN